MITIITAEFEIIHITWLKLIAQIYIKLQLSDLLYTIFLAQWIRIYIVLCGARVINRYLVDTAAKS